jgi:hypothetical protein
MSTTGKILIVLLTGILLLAAGGPQPWTSTALASFSGKEIVPNPMTIPYPGRLSNADGQAVVDGIYAFTFGLYDAESGGQLLWSEVQEVVMIKDGAFSVYLGSVSPIPSALLDGRDLWLSTSVRGPGEAGFTDLTPLQRVSAVSPGAPSDVATSGTCPHDHIGEVWTASVGWSNAALRINNSANGPSIWGWNSGGGNGVRGDGWGSGIGVYGEGENVSGVVGRSVNGYGVEGVSNVGSGGVWAHSTDGYGLFAHSDNNHSIYVDGAGAHGVYVASAGWDGVAIWSAAVAGLYVHSAGADGILVDTATWDGVHVVGPVGGVYYGSGKKGDEDFAVLNTGEVRSKVGFATPANDYAVMMSIQGAKSDYEPGDVLVVSRDQGQTAGLCSTSYSTAVIGVYSASPGFLGGQTVTGQAESNSSLPVAVMGIVLVKVSAENGPIHPGDLLVTSSAPGFAMRGEDPPPGTILGKALGTLESGNGTIQVLLTLQ